MTGRTHRQMRISNRSKANMLNDIYGSYYVNNSLSNNNITSKVERKAVSLIEKFYGIDFNDTLLDSIIQKQLQEIRDIHLRLTKIMKKVERAGIEGYLPYTTDDKMDKINNTIDKYNEFIRTTDNQLYLFEFNYSLIHLDKIISTITFNTSGGSRGNKQGLLPKSHSLQSIQASQPTTTSTSLVWNKKENKEYNDTQREYWLCKKCGFGHMLFEELI